MYGYGGRIRISTQLEILKMDQNIFTYTCEMPVQIGIGIAEHGQALLPKIPVPHLVCLLAREAVMLGAVQLDDQLFPGDVEIHDVGTDDLLAVDGQGKRFQKVIPQVPLLTGHVFA